MTQYATIPGGTVKYAYDATANDSNKDAITTGAGKLIKVLWIHCYLSNTATVGNRLMTVAILNTTPTVIGWFAPPFVQAASTNYHYNFIPSGASQGAASGSGVNNIDIGEIWLPAGYILRLYDSNAVDAAADDLTYTVAYIEYDA